MSSRFLPRRNVTSLVHRPVRALAHRFVVVLGSVAIASLAGCMSWFAPYRMEIQQGNYISQEVVSQLRPGMTRDQVRFLLGSPLVTDPFRPDRWDYIYTRAKQNSREVEARRLAVFFKDDVVERVSGDVVAAGEPGQPASPGARSN